MLQFAQMQGKSRLSRIIRTTTYSDDSHTAMRFTEPVRGIFDGREYFLKEGTVIEAWTGGVRIVDSLDAQHTPGTPVDLFELRQPLSLEQEQKVAGFLIAQKGRPYDYWNVVRFLPLVRAIAPQPAPEAWTREHVFCSELAMLAMANIHILLLERIPAWKVFPGLIRTSPLLRQTGCYTTKGTT